MIQTTDIKVVDSGQGYTIGEMPSTHKYLTYLKPTALVCLFDGVDTSLDFVGKNMPEPKREGSSDSRGRDRFNSFETYDVAMETFRKKPQSVVKYDQGELRVRDLSESGTQVDYDVVGDYIDMGRHMEGLPESWGAMYNGNARNRRVNLVLNMNQRSGMSEEDINHRGERVLRLVDALEAGGVRTQVTVIASTECSHIEILLKRHDEPLTISDLAVVSHSEFLRRIVFRIDEYSKTWTYGYGSSVAFSRCITPEIVEVESNNELNILVENNMEYGIDRMFDGLERLLQWEMSKPVPEVSSVKIDASGVWFNPNGARDEAEIRREGQEAING